MKRNAGQALVWLGVGLGILGSFGTVAARGQTPAEQAKTAATIAEYQNPDGGFGSRRGEPSSLGATSTALRVLGYTAGSVRDVPGAIGFVRKCHDEASGGFAATPGGKPTVDLTTSGLGALAALKLDAKPYADKAVAYFGREAKTYEEVRIAIAGLEAIDATSPDYPRWAAEVINKDRNPDGTYGTGPTKARATGGSAAALLRMKMTIEPDAKAAILATLRPAQNPDGGWGQQEGTSDLTTSYRIMRALYMMHEKPDLARLRAYLAKHRASDGAYATRPGAEADLGGTYSCTVMLYWARLLDGEPVNVETAGFSPLFDGRTLDGWDGDKALWKVQDGMIVGDSPGIRANQFLATSGEYDDFIFQCSVRLLGDAGNSGVQFRSVRVPGTEMSGYQADVGPGYWGSLYDESRRNRGLAPARPKALEKLRKGEWNQVTVRALGNHITYYLNGETSVDYREEDAAIARSGRIALQVHAGGPMRVEFKDLLIQRLPIAQPDASPNDATPGFHLRTLKGSPGEERKYVLSIPKGYDGSKALPVILFLHGSGERGTDGLQQAQIGMGGAILAHPDRFPCFVVIPQATRTWQADSDDARAAIRALDEVMAAYKVDPERQILTGLSMGGSGTWSNAAALPDRFAAIVPVCGRGQVATMDKLKALPIWTVVGDLDANPLQSLRECDDALRQLGASVRQTEYRNVPHDSWDRAYNDPALIAWMLAQRRNGR